ncbi:hypothetical protein [Mesorhizobium metallidurans]|uniref:hypothetical protein n=1 Tax=Mesorhizobium metallidurans TaxID=489722 RepID=UPI0012FC470B|nr:hypothetical protein [Mesorhizobium metallidurans]
MHRNIANFLGKAHCWFHGPNWPLFAGFERPSGRTFAAAKLLRTASRRPAIEFAESGDDLCAMAETASGRKRTALLSRDLAEMRLLLIQKSAWGSPFQYSSLCR